MANKKTNSAVKKRNAARQKKHSRKESMRQKQKTYLVDTSVIAQKKLVRLFKTRLSGTVVIPNAVIAELENLANKGIDAGFNGLEEIARLHKLKPRIKIRFLGPRPTDHQIRYAKSGEIDALIRSLAYKIKATLITADIVQAKSALAYRIEVYFVRTRRRKQKRKFFLFRRR